ncbi:T6SS immunity protein Tdi1 domain-containing protein [Herbaspirillum huttiense]|uniref:T6SS immunity protein Tdi1 domain-containing protein n=1 Tax=Herbaspirillum huttiense TaxID=863372 RepID=UPI0031D1254B
MKDEDGQPLFERARSKLGPLDPHEIYGFQPAIVLGGSFLLDNLVKVKANVHLTLLRMFGEATSFWRREYLDIFQSGISTMSREANLNELVFG